MLRKALLLRIMKNKLKINKNSEICPQKGIFHYDVGKIWPSSIEIRARRAHNLSPTRVPTCVCALFRADYVVVSPHNTHDARASCFPDVLSLKHPIL